MGVSTIFTVGPVHTRGNDLGCSDVGSEHVTRQTKGEAYIYMPIQGEGIYINKGASSPFGTPGGLRIDPEDFSCATYLYHCKHDHKLISISFPIPV